MNNSDMNLLPVIVKRVAFGTPEYIFLRTDINILIEKRNALKYAYRDSDVHVQEAYGLVCKMVRNLAELVYFIKPVKRPVVIPSAPPEPYKQQQPKRKRLNKTTPSQTSLF